MDTQFIVKLKRKFVAKYGARAPSSIVNDYLIAKAPEFYQARAIIHSGNADWPILKKYSTFCRYDESHKEYKSLLQEFDPALRFPDTTYAQFIGDGFGDGSLNSYRLVHIHNKHYFEKIYLKESLDYKNIMWFYMNIQRIIASAGLESPAFGYLVEGDRLSVVYSEFINDTRLIPRTSAMSYYKKKFHIFNNINPQSDDMHAFNFINHVLYQDGKRKAIKFISQSCDEGFEAVSIMEKKVNNAMTIFSHGDWYLKNINRKGIVFDWDRCGYYPAGFDLAYCFSKSFKVISLTGLNRIINKVAPSILSTECIPVIWYFCFISTIIIWY